MTSFWDSEEIYFNGEEYFDRMLADLRGARHSITVEMYIFNADALGRKIATELMAAKARGVKVQVSIDGVGSLSFPLSPELTQAGVQVKYYNPLPFYHPYHGQLTLMRKLQVLLGRVLRLNQRDHRKLVTIDEAILYGGSFNFSAEHTNLSGAPSWKDMGVRVTGTGVKFAVLNFRRNWRFRDYLKFKRTLKGQHKFNWKQVPLRLNQTLLMKSYFHEDFLRRINQAKTRIWFTSPYFIPKRRVIRALGKAAKRGVDVRLLLSSKSDVRLFHTLQFFHYPYLIKAGVKVFQYSDTVLHAKNYIIDDWMTIGSTNLNHRSVIHDLEVDLVIQDEDNKKKVAEHFMDCCLSQPQVTQEWFLQRPLWDRVLSRLFFLFRYWF